MPASHPLLPVLARAAIQLLSSRCPTSRLQCCSALTVHRTCSANSCSAAQKPRRVEKAHYRSRPVALPGCSQNSRSRLRPSGSSGRFPALLLGSDTPLLPLLAEAPHLQRLAQLADYSFESVRCRL